MCGIAGKFFLDPSRRVTPEEIDTIMDPMSHRGPDGRGVHLDGPVGLGHLRLSIIDLATGSQPLCNEDGTIWTVFNGEIYNFKELRIQLESKGHRFKTSTDTEVIVHAYEEYGAKCVEHFRGMFAFAIWDSKKRRLFLARDRVGIKPLYYVQTKRGLIFASEIKGLLTDPDVSHELMPEAIDLLWCFRYLPGEVTMFKQIRKLLPGFTMEFSADGKLTTQQFWDLKFNATDEYSSLDAAAKGLSELLHETIRLHMIADVPVGFLLSGGMDSSAVLSYAAKQTTMEINTFTLGFEGQGVVDERPFARLMAKQCGARHHETTITAQEFWDTLPTVLRALEDPICDSATVGLHFVSRMASRHVKVLISGEGGDEAFGGYPNYPNQLALQKIRAMCGPFRRLVGSGGSAIGALLGNRRVQDYSRLLPLKLSDYYWSRAGSPFEREPGIAGIKYSDGYRQSIAGAHMGRTIMEGLFDKMAGQPLLSQMLYVDTKSWLPDYLLLKADKVTMASSIELRVPLLDHKVLEFAASLPARFKVNGRETKRVLKTAFTGVLPQAIVDRKKVGFPVPHGKWLAGELWEPTRDLLLASNSLVGSYFDRQSIADMLDRHRTTHQLQREVFSLLAIELWHKQFNGAQAKGPSKPSVMSP